MSDVLKTISLDGFSKNVRQYVAGSGITFTTDSQDTNKIIIAAVATDLSNYYTKNETYSKNEVNDLIDAIDQFKVEVVNALPASGQEKTIYLVPKSGGSGNNVRDEYMWINGAWEKIGDTDVDLSNYYNKSETDTLLDAKQDTLTAGQNIQIAQDGTISATDTTYNPATQSTDGLMSAADKTKLDGIETGAEANVQSDWNQTDTTADDYIKNKPGTATQSTDGFMSSADKTKLDGIEAGAEENVQSDWNQTDNTADDFIKNKPGNATQSTDGFMSSQDKVKLDGIETGAEQNVQSDWNQTDTTADDFIKNKPGNATQSTDGFMSSQDKTKLDGIEAGAEANVQSDWNQTDSSADDYIKNKPGNATQSTAGLMSAADKTKLDGIDLTDYLTCSDLEDCPTITDMQSDIADLQTEKLDATKQAVLTALGYEEVELSMTDTEGNTITKTILAKIEETPGGGTVIFDSGGYIESFEYADVTEPEIIAILRTIQIGDQFRISWKNVGEQELNTGVATLSEDNCVQYPCAHAFKQYHPIYEFYTNNGGPYFSIDVPNNMETGYWEFSFNGALNYLKIEKL